MSSPTHRLSLAAAVLAGVLALPCIQDAVSGFACRLASRSEAGQVEFVRVALSRAITAVRVPAVRVPGHRNAAKAQVGSGPHRGNRGIAVRVHIFNINA